MEILINRDDLFSAVTQVQGVVETRKSLPVLSHMLLQVVPGQLSLFSTDLEVGIRVAMEVEGSGEGEVALPAKRFYDILRELPSQPVRLVIESDLITNIECDRARFRLKGIPKEDFPQVPAMETKDSLVFRRDLLQEMISKTLFAVSTDQTRYSLSGVLFQAQEDIRMVATDGHRLAIVKRPRKEVQGGVKRETIIPKKALVEIMRLLKEGEDPVRLDFANSHLIINLHRSTLTSRLIEEQFPNYAAVIPEPTGKRAVLSREQLTGALRRTATIVGERGAPTRIELSGNRMLVTCSNMDLGEATEFLDVDYSGEDISIGFNGRYLLDFLSVVNEEQIVIHFTDSLSPTLFQPLGNDWYQCVIMPMRI